jgi:hypothetical protein
MGSIWIDQGENGLRIDHADEDGIHIVEAGSNPHKENKVYIYYSELPRLIDALIKLNSTCNKGVGV